LTADSQRYIVIYQRHTKEVNHMYAHIHPHTHPGAHFLAMGGGHRGHGHGRGPFGSFGPRGPRARRGDVRAALLLLLAEEPRNGYQLIQEIEQRSDGAWRPSPGSIYPALQLLEDERLAVTVERDGTRMFEITDAGREWVAQRDTNAPAPWDAVKDEGGQGARQLMKLVREVAQAAAQVVQAGDDAQLAKAQDLLRETRRSLYRILAEETGGDDTA
jgi:DNA-binding PadR family transcriptional regulator